MSKMKLLLDVVSDLRSLADSLQAVADAARTGRTGTAGPNHGGKAGSETRKEKMLRKSRVEPPVEKPEPKPLTLEQVRAALAQRSSVPDTRQVKALLIKHGADKLSDIDPAGTPALLAEAEVL